jgi:hypothetical protein
VISIENTNIYINSNISERVREVDEKKENGGSAGYFKGILFIEIFAWKCCMESSRD